MKEDKTAPKEAGNELLKVIGIGASAGGLEAIQELFDNIPADTGHTFVIIQHLSPDYKSLMPELLAKHTEMEIFTAQDKQELQPNCIYLNQSKNNLHVKGNRLYQLDKGPRQNLNLPIDIFFHTLGEEFGEDSIGIILSGTGSDGSRGIKTIKEAGGLIFVQKPDTAHFDGMPNSSIATGLVDFVMTPELIGSSIARYPSTKLHDLFDSKNETVDDIFVKILVVLQKHTGVDFQKYKKNTLARRLEKRININHVGSLRSYLDLLKNSKIERDQLYADFLIGVTSFFRDQAAFDVLEQELLPNLLGTRNDDSTIRIWTPGCSTGEEAYSLAIMIDRYLVQHDIHRDYKIFATDIHEASLVKAGLGIFNINASQEIAKKYFESYFVKNGDQIQIIKRIRDKIIFAKNNVIKDPPFIRMDLIVCRNVLIYFENEAQELVIDNFSFALKENGYLFLGSSESLGRYSSNYKAINSKWKLFEMVNPPPRNMARRIEVEQNEYKGFEPIFSQPSPKFHEATETPYYKFLSDQFSPSLIFIDREFDIKFIKGNINNKLNIKEGLFQRNLIQMVDHNLAVIIRNGIRRTLKDNSPVVAKDIIIDENAEKKFDIKIYQVDIKSPEKLFVVEFGKDEAVTDSHVELQHVDLDNVANQRIDELEEELKTKNSELRNLTEELETTNEELQSSNEELMASNEELQSTNEELQSVNEELYTVNSELQEKNEELMKVYNDLNNLYKSQEIATIFLDKQLNIRFFTPSIQSMLKLKDGDIGRSIENFMFFDEKTRLQLIQEAKKSLKDGKRFESKIVDAGTRYLMRIYPFLNGRAIEGVNITLIDINELSKAQVELEKEKKFKDSITESLTTGIYIYDFKESSNTYVNEGYEAILGYTKEDLDQISQDNFNQLFHPDDLEKVVVHMNELISNKARCSLRYRFKHKDGHYVHCFSVDAPYEFDGEGNLKSFIGSFIDISELHKKEEQLIEARNEALNANNQKDIFLSNLSHEIRTPMTSVLGFSKLLKQKRLSVKDKEHYIMQIERNSRLLMTIINDILDISKLEKGKLSIQKETFSIDNLLEQIIESEQEEIKIDGEKELNIAFKRPKSTKGETMIYSDPVRLAQVVNNLLTNAVKFTPKGTIEVGYSLVKDKNIKVWVKDEGIGIREDHQELIFDRFSQIEEQLSLQLGGIGLGLAISKSITTALGGNISLESTYGVGSTFTIQLPLDEAAQKAPIKTSIGTGKSKISKVLVADDSASIQSYYKILLERFNIDTLQAYDGIEAVEMVKKHKDIGLILMDIRMPRMDGLEAYQEIRKINTDVRIVAQSAFAMEDQIEKFKKLGFDEYLTKPITEDRIIELLAEEE